MNMYACMNMYNYPFIYVHAYVHMHMTPRPRDVNAHIAVQMNIGTSQPAPLTHLTFSRTSPSRPMCIQRLYTMPPCSPTTLHLPSCTSLHPSIANPTTLCMTEIVCGCASPESSRRQQSTRRQWHEVESRRFFAFHFSETGCCVCLENFRVECVAGRRCNRAEV